MHLLTFFLNLMITSSIVQISPLRFCNHSKYEPITPPELHKMSGMISIPFANKIASPSVSIGPFAPSAITFAFTVSAFTSVIWFPKSCRDYDVTLHSEEIGTVVILRVFETGNGSVISLET